MALLKLGNKSLRVNFRLTKNTIGAAGPDLRIFAVAEVGPTLSSRCCAAQDVIKIKRRSDRAIFERWVSFLNVYTRIRILIV